MVYMELIPNAPEIVYFLFLSFFFKFCFILLYNTVLVLPYININPPRVYMSFQS